MADDVFGNPDLFAEFERSDDRTDKILMTKFDREERHEPKKLQTNNQNTHISLESDEDEVRWDMGSNPGGSPENSEGEFEINGEIETGIGAGKTHRGIKNGSLESEVRRLKSELQIVKQERDRLQRNNRIISTSKYFKHNVGPAIQVLYMNHRLASEHKLRIDDFLTQILTSSVPSEDTYDDIRKIHSTRFLDDVEPGFPEPEEAIRRLRSSSVIGCNQWYSDFLIDSMGWYLVANNPGVTEGWQIPLYQQIFSTPLPMADAPVDTGPKPKEKFKSSCFNCGGDHNLKDCQQPRNQAKINESRQKFQQKQPQSNRYHIEDDPRFSKFKPGSVSEDLRQAMNLSSRQLPPYIYQMRILGYPPGHLETLTEGSSGISMYDKHGNEVAVDGDAGEDGEVEVTEKPDYMDVKKIIQYPGFNMPLEDDQIDEFSELGMPQMNRSQSVEVMAETFNMRNKDSRRGTKRLSTDNGYSGSSASKRKRTKPLDSSDMDISASEDSSPMKPLPLSRVETIVISSQEEDSDGSLQELEKQKALIQQQLAASEGSDSDIQIVDDINESGKDAPGTFLPPLPPKGTTPIRPPLPESTPPKTPLGKMKLPLPKGTPSTPTADADVSSFAGSTLTPKPVPMQTPEGPPRLLRTPSSGGSINMALGTPISENKKAIASKGLPIADKFAEGITQHIPFENLPGTTGNYKRLLETLKKRESL